MSRRSIASLAAVCALSLAFGLEGCRDFEVPRLPATQAVTLVPDQAFGDEEIALRFTGTVDVAKVQVSIGGKLATVPEGQEGKGEVRAVVPRLPGTCESLVPVLVSAPGFSFQAATLTYKGAGHPGSPRPALTGDGKAVSFVPKSVAVVAGDQLMEMMVASGHGEAVVALPVDGSGKRAAAIWRSDFVLGLASPNGGLVVDVQQHGQVEQFALASNLTSVGDWAVDGGEKPGPTPPPPDLACQLPSALSQPPSLAVLVPGSGGGTGTKDPPDAGDPDATVSYRGLIVAAESTLRAFALEAREEALAQRPSDEVAGFAGGSSCAVAAAGERFVLFRGGATPQVRLVEPDGKGPVTDFGVPAQGDEWTVASSGGSPAGVAAAYLQSPLGLDGRLLVVVQPGGGGGPPSPTCSPDCTGGESCGSNGTCRKDVSGCDCVEQVPVFDCSGDQAPACGSTCSARGQSGACVPDVSGNACECKLSGPPDPCASAGAPVCLDYEPCSWADGFPGALGYCAPDGPAACSCFSSPPDKQCDQTPTCGGKCVVSGMVGACVDDGLGGCACDIGLASTPDAGTSGLEDAGGGPPPPIDDGGRGGGPGGGTADGGVDVPRLFELPVHGSPLTSLAVDGENKIVWAVDGVSTWLRAFSVGGEPTELTLGGSLPLPEPGIRVVLAPGDGQPFPVVIGRSGRIYRAPAFNAEAIPVGVSSIAPRLPSSCEAPQAVVAVSELGGTAVVPTSEGVVAFLEGAPGARFADTVSFGRDGGVPLTYFYSGGIIPPPDAGYTYDAGATPDTGLPVGFLVSQTATQGFDLAPDGGMPKKAVFHFSARSATSIRSSDGPATLVVGGPDGVRFLKVAAGSLPDEASAVFDGTCSDVRKLAALGDGTARVFALGRKEQVDGGVEQTVCLVDANSHQFEVGKVPAAVASIATATTLEDLQAVTHLYTVGWEAKSGAQALVVRHALASAAHPLAELAPLEWGAWAGQLLPIGGAPISALSASPDGRRLLVALAGENPGMLSIDPWPFLHGGTDEEKAAAITTVMLSAAPVGIGFTADGALAVIALSDDTLAFVQ